MSRSLALLVVVAVGAGCALDDAGTADPTTGGASATTAASAGAGGGDTTTVSGAASSTSTGSASNAASGGTGDAAGGASGTGGDPGTAGGDGSGGAGPSPFCGDDEINGDEECEGGWPCKECQVECPAGWFEGSATHTCYGRSLEEGDDDNLEERCDALRGQGGVPGDAAIRPATPNEPDDIPAVVEACGDEIDEDDGCWLWADDDDDGTFVWHSGEPFDYDPNQSPWADGEPDGSGDCVEVWAPEPTTRPLHDEACFFDQYIICEAAPVPPG